jgi:hypothetical protein
MLKYKYAVYALSLSCNAIIFVAAADTTAGWAGSYRPMSSLVTFNINFLPKLLACFHFLIYKKRVVVQNKLNILVKIFL